MPRRDRNTNNNRFDFEYNPKLFKRKIFVVCSIFAAIAFVIVAKLIWLCVVDGPALNDAASSMRTNKIVLQAKRGTIYDRNGNVLASSIECKTIYCNPKEIDNPQKVAKILYDYLGGSGEAYLEALTKDTTFSYISKKVDTDKAKKLTDALRGEKLSGIYTLQDMKRVYPYGDVAGQVLGLVGSEGEGRTGLELQYDDILSGEDGFRTCEMGSDGTPIAGGAYKETAPKDGSDIVISIDVNIQKMVEAKLIEGKEKYATESAYGIVMDPKSGELLAMASTPLLPISTMSGDITADMMTLSPVVSSYEPGSVFKILTTSIGMDNGTFNQNTSFFVPASTEVGWDKVADDDGRDYDMDMTPREIMRRSSNVGAVVMGEAIGKEAFSEGIKKFGIGEATGIDYPGESAGLVTKLEDYVGATLGAMSFGQSVAIPGIQMVRATSAISNEGKLVTPHFLVYKGEEKVDWTCNKQACSASTAKVLSSIMQEVVTDGTAKSAAVEGFDVAAKTGTGEQASSEGGYKKGSFLSSLVGFAPAQNPQILAYIAYNGTYLHASECAAPTFSAIMQEALMDLNIAPTN